jgi:hypothetical protein
VFISARAVAAAFGSVLVEPLAPVQLIWILLQLQNRTVKHEKIMVYDFFTKKEWSHKIFL